MPEKPPEPQQVPNYGAPTAAPCRRWLLLAGVGLIAAAATAGVVPEPAPLVGDLILVGCTAGSLLVVAGLLLRARERR